MARLLELNDARSRVRIAPELGGGVADMVIGAILPEVFGYLRAPLEKVGAAHTPVPSSPELEDLVMPSSRAVVQAGLRLIEQF